MKTIVFEEVINVSKSKTWDVLFNRFGDVALHNPNLENSNFLNDSKTGGLDCERHCSLDAKTYVKEKITDIQGNDRFAFVVTDSNLPMVKEMKGDYQVIELAPDKTKVIFTMNIATSPSFMIYVMKGKMKKILQKSLIGMKYYLETGVTVQKDLFSIVFKTYQQMEASASF